MIIESQDQKYFQPPKLPLTQAVQTALNKKEFFCPNNQFLYKTHLSIEQLKQKIKLEADHNNQQHNLWIIKRVKNNYLYFNCRYCRAHLNYKIQKNQLFLTSSNNFHIHSLKSYKKIQEQRILDYINTISQNYTQKQLMFHIIQKYSISRRRCYYIFHKSQSNKSFIDVFKWFRQNQYQYFIDWGQENQIPELLLFNSKSMANMYKQYGDSISFDISYNLIKHRSHNNRQWGCGVFSGMDSNLRIVIFAVVLISKETSQNFKKIFKAFFELYHIQPSVIITDQQIAITSALEQLKRQKIFQGLHLLDIFHVLKNVRKRVQKKDFGFYLTLIKARNEQSFQNKLENIINHTDCDTILLQQFVQKSKRFCFSEVPAAFLGFSSSNSRSQKLNDLLKNVVPHQINIFSFLRKINKFSEDINKKTINFQKEIKKFEQLFQDFGVGEVRKKIQKKIFERFIQNYTRGLRLIIQQIQHKQQYICYNLKQNWKVTIVEQQYFCMCKIKQKTGILCQHILKVMWSLGKHNYVEHLNSRWLKETQDTKDDRGRPKFSRKNIL